MRRLREFFERLIAVKPAKYALAMLLFLYVCVFGAGFVTTYSANESDRQMSYVPPSKIYVIDDKGKLSKPYTYNFTRIYDKENFRIIWLEDKSKKYAVKYFAKGRPYKLFGVLPVNRHFIDVENGGKLHLLGTDVNGRDNFSRLLYGGQISLTIGFLAIFVSFPIGLLYGGISGYTGGKTDFVMMRVAEAIMSIPSFYLLIILAAVLPAGMSGAQRFALVAVILALTGWAGFARVIRGMVLSIKNEEFVLAAKSFGASKIRIIAKHILPQTLSYVTVAITLSVPSYILAESGLSFLGLGIRQPDASWGNMLKEAQEYANVVSRPWLLAPGILIFVTVLAFNIIGDTIRDITDPKSKER